MRLIITSRDVGSAKQNLAFLEQINNEGFLLEVKILAQGPAIQIFKNSEFNFISIEESFSLSNQNNKSFLEDAIDSFGPNFALLGLSYFDIGVDEYVRDYCRVKKIQCGVIQDYWGYIGQYKISNLPNIFFVIDEQAKKLTEEKTDSRANCFVTGSPKHEQYNTFLESWSQLDPFEDYESFNILFIGQPYEMDGYLENITCFFDVLNKLDFPFTLFIKDHPNNKSEIYSNIIKGYKLDYKILSKDSPIENALYHADLVVTCCSTAGFDHAYMQYYSSNLLGHLLYLSIGKDIVDFFRKNVGDITISELINGMGRVAYNADEIKTNIVDLLHYNKPDYKYAVDENLKKSKKSSKKIYNLIKTLIK